MKRFITNVGGSHGTPWRRAMAAAAVAAVGVLVLGFGGRLRAADDGTQAGASGPAAKATPLDVKVTWDLVGWHDAADNPFDYMGEVKPVVVKERKLLDGSIIYCGIGVGGKATSKEDKTYQEYLKAVTKGVHAGLSKEDKATPVPVTINKVEYQKFLAAGPDDVFEALVGIENGVCVSYWYGGGPPSELKGFHAGVGKVKISYPPDKSAVPSAPKADK